MTAAVVSCEQKLQKMLSYDSDDDDGDNDDDDDDNDDDDVKPCVEDEESVVVRR